MSNWRESSNHTSFVCLDQPTTCTLLLFSLQSTCVAPLFILLVVCRFKKDTFTTNFELSSLLGRAPASVTCLIQIFLLLSQHLDFEITLATTLTIVCVCVRESVRVRGGHCSWVRWNLDRQRPQKRTKSLCKIFPTHTGFSLFSFSPSHRLFFIEEKIFSTLALSLSLALSH